MSWCQGKDGGGLAFLGGGEEAVMWVNLDGRSMEIEPRLFGGIDAPVRVLTDRIKTVVNIIFSWLQWVKSY